MGILGNWLIAKSLVSNATKPKQACFGRMDMRNNWMLLGGVGQHASALREAAVLAYIAHWAERGIPMVMLSSDANLAADAADQSGGILFGRDASYDPLASCTSIGAAKRMFEYLLMQLAARRGTLPYAQTSNLVGIFLEAMYDSFGLDALMYGNLESLYQNLAAHHCAESFLRWMQQAGYRVTQALNHAIQNSWPSGLQEFLMMMGMVSHALESVRGTGLDEAGLSELLMESSVVAAYIPPDDCGLLALLFGSELISLTQNGRYVGFVNDDVSLPEPMLPLFHAQYAELPCACVMRTPQTLQQTDIRLEQMLPRMDALIVLGMANMQEAQSVLDVCSATRLRLMPNISSGREGGIGFGAMPVNYPAEVFMAGSRNIPDGGGVIIELGNHRLTSYQRLTV